MGESDSRDSILNSILDKGSRFSITGSQYSIFTGIENRGENRDSQQTVNLILNGTVGH